MPGQEPPLKLFINLMKAALESLKFSQEYSDLPREYLFELGERLFQYSIFLKITLDYSVIYLKSISVNSSPDIFLSLVIHLGKFFLWDIPYRIVTSICMITYKNCT